MPTSGAVSPGHDQSATLRQLKVLVVVLVLSNIGLGAFSAYLLRSTDARYSRLVERSVPALNDLRAETAQLAVAVRLTGIPLLRAADGERASAVQKARSAIERDRELRGKVMNDAWPPTAHDSRAEIQRSGDQFDSASEQVIALVATGRVDEAAKAREEALRPAFDDYLGVIAKAADAVEGASLKASGDMSAHTGSMAAVLLGLAGWPVIVLVALLFLTAVFVIVLMVLFRGREMSDMP
jgi:hypothetical protein